ncbi:MAG: hypothetical protein U0787_01185 [Polyangia bacterium]
MRGHPFPNVRNKTAQTCLIFAAARCPRAARTGSSFAVMQVPSVFSRLVEVPTKGPRRVFVCLEDVISLRR